MVEYKEFRVGDLFEPVLNTSRTLQKQETGEYPLVCGSGVNNGRDGFTDVSDVVYENEITISTRGSSGSTFYQKGSFVLNNNAMVLKAKFEKRHRVLLYIARNIGSLGYNGYQHYPTKRGIVDDLILLPVTPQDTPDFDYMENYIKEIEQKHIKKLESDLATRTENLLTVIGREDLVGDPDGLAAVVDKGFDASGVEFAEFVIDELFSDIESGKRLKKDDHEEGSLPFVMSGFVNQGISGNIGNDVKIYPANSITVDILGNVFYRNSEYGLSDDVVSLMNNDIPKGVQLYIATALSKELTGRFDYGKKFRKRDTSNISVQLPVTPEGEPDFEYMEAYITFIELKHTHTLITYVQEKELS